MGTTYGWWLPWYSEISHGRCWMVIKRAWLDVTSESYLQVSSQRLSVGMTPKTLRLPKPGEMLLSVHGSPLGVYKEDNMEAIHGMKSIYIFSCSCRQHCIEGACLLYSFFLLLVACYIHIVKKVEYQIHLAALHPLLLWRFVPLLNVNWMG